MQRSKEHKDSKTRVYLMAEKAVINLKKESNLLTTSRIKTIIHHLENILELNKNDQEIINTFKLQLENLKNDSAYYKIILQFIKETNLFYKITSGPLGIIYDLSSPNDALRMLKLCKSTYLSLHNKFQIEAAKTQSEPRNYHTSPTWYEAKIEIEDKQKDIVTVQKLWENEWAVALDNNKLYVCNRTLSKSANSSKPNIAKLTIKQELRESKSKVKNIVVLQDKWITQTEEHKEGHEFCVWNKQNKLLYVKSFKPSTSFSKINFSIVFENGQIMIAEPRHIFVYESNNHEFKLIKEFHDCVNPIRAMCFNKSWVILDQEKGETTVNTLYSFNKESDKHCTKQIVNLQNKFSAEYFTANVFTDDSKKTKTLKLISATTLTEFDIADNIIRDGKIYCLPYGQWMHTFDQTKSDRTMVLMLSNFSFIDKKVHFNTELGSQENYSHCVPLSDGNLFFKRTSSTGFQIFTATTREPVVRVPK